MYRTIAKSLTILGKLQKQQTVVYNEASEAAAPRETVPVD